MTKSFLIPFNVVGGRIGTTSDTTTIVEQKIIDVLSTNKLERPTFPDYGVGVQHLLFEGIDELVESDFKADAGPELSSRITGLGVIDLALSKSEDEDTSATLRVLYRTTLSAPRSLSFKIATPFTDEETPI